MRLTRKIDRYIKEKYNVLFEFECFDYLDDFTRLEADLNKIKKEVFDPLDRIILYRFETDFYNDFLNTGLSIRNAIESIRKADIPFYNILVFTNHQSIKKELDFLLKNDQQKITVVETYAIGIDIDYEFKNVVINEKSITKPAVCLMGGSSRGHRHILFNYFKQNNLLPLIATSYKN
jgi:hypothetical protein